MEFRNLGHTGMQVSPLCLGAMMFGACGYGALTDPFLRRRRVA